MRCTELINSETPDGLVWNQIMDETDAGKHLPKKPGSEVLGHGRRSSSLKCCEIFLSFCVRAHTWETLRSAASQRICGFLFCVQGHIAVSCGAWAPKELRVPPHVCRSQDSPSQLLGALPPAHLRLAAQGTLQDLLKVIII